MSKRANPTLIGVFVLGAVTLGVVTVLLLGGGQWFR
ncbi:MAG: mammalian cell entry protein, partial [Deltaproteobacteria bacterium CG23_combo_of_CG06-09_8_20_14_all_60_8]